MRKRGANGTETAVSYMELFCDRKKNKIEQMEGKLSEKSLLKEGQSTKFYHKSEKTHTRRKTNK